MVAVKPFSRVVLCALLMASAGTPVHLCGPSDRCCVSITLLSSVCLRLSDTCSSWTAQWWQRRWMTWTAPTSRTQRSPKTSPPPSTMGRTQRSLRHRFCLSWQTMEVRLAPAHTRPHLASTLVCARRGLRSAHSLNYSHPPPSLPLAPPRAPPRAPLRAPPRAHPRRVRNLSQRVRWASPTTF